MNFIKNNIKPYNQNYTLIQFKNKHNQNNQKYSKHKKRLNELSVTLTLMTTDGKEYITSRNQETKDTYNIEINDYVEAYKSEFNLDTNPYAIDVINHYKDIKDMFTLTLDSIMSRLNLSENTKSASKNIFDILIEEISNISTNKAS